MKEKSEQSPTDYHYKDPYWVSYTSLADLPPVFQRWIDLHGFDLISVCDHQGAIQYVTASSKRLIGYTKDALLGTYILDYVSPQDKIRLMKSLRKNEKGDLVTSEVQVKHRSGTYIWVEVVSSSVYDPKTRDDVVIAVIRDISDRKEAEEMMIRSEKMSVAGQLAAGIAHEIRNPLTSLKGFLQLLEAGIEGKDEYYSIMGEEIDKIENITSELLFISKPMTNDPKEESVVSLMKDVCKLMETQAHLHNVDIEIKQEEWLKVYCDRSQIKQVFINIIKNAIEVMSDSGGTVSIDIYERNGDACMDVIDEGPGIPEHLIEKIKEPFFTTKKNGTGLGLMITNQILEKHDGSLTILNNEPKGSIFRIRLPLYLS
ncbi:MULTISPECIES: ATP-binding protein [Pontibacillus]|uniref:histidine kinase n=1 Tax=Pontibacillus chungwhensis TaxID=265426 RepID=A0ABY8V3M4_9BACI|nr:MULTISPECIES: ATP-binding protein [Pontibacillus]MCD5322789.1 PAS domain S-box protein [Pontibacillus sp. HN14]WIG00059.1 PAS domain S-box protein [Pontibacillus chungwhensis]